MNNWIKTNREALGLSKAELAEVVGVHWVSVFNWESGKTSPGKTAWSRLAAFFQAHGLEVPERTKAEHREVSKLEAVRMAAGLTRQQVAEALGVNRNAPTEWEAGKKRPRDHHILALAELLHCTPDDMGLPLIRNGLTVEERNDLVMECLYQIDRVMNKNRTWIMATGANRADIYQDLALALIKAVGSKRLTGDELDAYILVSLQGALKNSINGLINAGLTHIPPGERASVQSLNYMKDCGFQFSNDGELH